MPYRTRPVYEDSSLALMARLVASDATYVVQADVSSIALKIYDYLDPDTVLNSSAPVVASTIFDTLQTDARWHADSTGYNFRYGVTPSKIPAGNKVYRFEFILTMADGGSIPVVFEVPTMSLFSS